MTFIVPRIASATPLTSNATTLNGLPASYYLDCNNFVNCPDSLLDFGVTDGPNGSVLTTDGAGKFSFKPLVFSNIVDGGSAAALYSTAFIIDGVNSSVVYTQNPQLNFNCGAA
jgi:hypothetical protein